MPSSSRRSSFVPTRMMGTPGAWWSISGYHWAGSVVWLWLVMAGTYLGLYIVERRRADNGEANEKNVCLGVREWSQPVVIFLSSSIPQSQADGLAINHYICGVVVEAGDDVSSGAGGSLVRPDSHSRNVLSGKGIRCVGNQETCLHG